MEPGRANPRCIPSASLRWACLPASGGKDVLGAQRLPPRPLTQHCHGLPPAWDPCPGSFLRHFRPGGSFRAMLGWSWGSNTYHAGSQETAGTGRSLCFVLPPRCSPSLSTRGLTAARGDEAARSISHAEPAVPRGARGTAAELASARGRGCSPGAQPLCFVSCSPNPSLPGR